MDERERIQTVSLSDGAASGEVGPVLADLRGELRRDGALARSCERDLIDDERRALDDLERDRDRVVRRVEDDVVVHIGTREAAGRVVPLEANHVAGQLNRVERVDRSFLGAAENEKELRWRGLGRDLKLEGRRQQRLRVLERKL